MNDYKLLSEKEAADFLGISKSTLIRKRTSGEVAFYQVGTRIRYSLDSHLLPYLKDCERNGKELDLGLSV